MKGNKGIIYTFKTKEGKIQKAIAYQSEQAAEFKDVKKVFLRYIGEDFKPLKDGNGKNIVGLKSATELTIIGFVD